MLSRCGLKSALLAAASSGTQIAAIMPKRFSLLMALASALALFTHATFAQTWQTVDDFQYVSGMASENSGLRVAPSGTLFAAGFGNDSTGGHALVMASSDGGNSWSAPLDDFLYQGVTRASYVGGIVADASGNLYAAGCAGIEFLTSRWLVRRSTDNGLTWSTVDDFSLGRLRNVAYAIAADAVGNIYVAGLASTSTTSYGPVTWVVRKGVNGTSWSTVDTFSPGIYGGLTNQIIPFRNNGAGTLYKLNKDGSGYSIVHNFSPSGSGDAALPTSLVQGSDGALYGTSEIGGGYDGGTVFRLSDTPPPPVLQSVTRTGATLALAWSAYAAGNYQLQYTTNLLQTNWTNLGNPVSQTNWSYLGDPVIATNTVASRLMSLARIASAFTVSCCCLEKAFRKKLTLSPVLPTRQSNENFIEMRPATLCRKASDREPRTADPRGINTLVRHLRTQLPISSTLSL